MSMLGGDLQRPADDLGGRQFEWATSARAAATA